MQILTNTIYKSILRRSFVEALCTIPVILLVFFVQLRPSFVLGMPSRILVFVKLKELSTVCDAFTIPMISYPYIMCTSAV